MGMKIFLIRFDEDATREDQGLSSIWEEEESNLKQPADRVYQSLICFLVKGPKPRMTCDGEELKSRTQEEVSSYWVNE